MQGHKIQAFSLFAALILETSVLSKSLQKSQDGDIRTNSIAYLGTVDGKSYFYEYLPLRNWFEAKEACNASNMHLASITTRDQAEFLNNVDAPKYDDHWFWTAGRDSLSLSQFLWEVDNVPVINQGLTFYAFAPIQSCLMYLPRKTGGHLYSYECTDGRGTLCEIRHN